MALSPGTRLGAYEILSLLGSGGMGEVYRARDTKLGRDVALKILPPAFTSDPDRLARFRREAQVLASLNHPHIGAIYGLDDSDGTQFLVLELVDGESLDKRIARGRIPIDEALTIAKQIAEALEAAHEKGIIHRDLKPVNIALTHDGSVKVLDFGLAKPTEAASGPSFDVTNSPTITSPAMMTGVGVILGTAAYMSPEQAKGRPADKRTDIWAFGCVLFEMISGARAFGGEDVSDTLASVIKSDPDWTALPSNAPYAIQALVQTCLKKDRKARIADISTALFLLNHPQAVATSPASTQRSPRGWRRAVLVGAGVAIGAAVVAALLWRQQPSVPLAVTRFGISLPPGQRLTLSRQAVAISPDGKHIVFAADGRLYQRAMSEIDVRPIPGGEAALGPVFSPDGQWLVFWNTADSALKKIPVTGGTPLTVCPISPAPAGMSWDRDGILFAEPGIGIMRVSPNGGKPDVVIGVDPSETKSLVQGPQQLPGGFVLFTVVRRSATDVPWDQAQVVVQSLKTGERRTVIDGGADARYVPTGHLVYAVGGTLFAVPFDPARLAVTGGSVPIIEGVARSTSISGGAAHFAFANSGSMVYLPGPPSAGRQDVMLFDRKGGAEALKLPPGSYSYPRASPDGTRLALETRDAKETNVSIYELSGAHSIRRLTFGGNNHFPIWSADGRRVAFQSDRERDGAIYWQAADGGAAEQLTHPERDTTHVPESWSPDGDAFLFNVTKGADVSLWTFSLRDRKATPFDDVRSVIFATDAIFSPDGRWVAYQVGQPNEGEATTFIQPFPPNGTKYQIARGGRPLWSRDGTELFLVPAPGLFVSVKVGTRPTFAFTNPMAVPRGFGIADPVNPRPYDAMPDGRIVGIGTLAPAEGGSSGAAQIQVVLSWFEELKARVPTK